ncbi:hypothetical protein M9Y10_033536 [Tritrichomonas musculus]|uniref:G domain-containing protein n=1 Tax=Tritrichomonas musculus TaxID=1915356 RepID=A0ABR2KED1_9EUKA
MSDLVNKVKNSEANVQKQLNKIGNPSNMHTILFVGPTGSGKTTLFYSLISGALRVSGPRNSLRLDAEVSIDGFEIGHNGESKTEIPTLYRNPSKNIVFCDCPGFFDTSGGVQDVPNAFAIDQVLSHTKYAKILFVVSEADIDSSKAQFFEKSSIFVEELIPNYESKENSVCLVITKADDYESDPIDFLPDLCPRSPSLLKFFRNHPNLIFQFSAPPLQVVRYDTYQDKQRLISFIYDAPTPEISSFGIALSDESKLTILQQAASMGSISTLLNQFKNYFVSDLSGSRNELLTWRDRIGKLMDLRIEDPKEFRYKVESNIPSKSEYNQIYSKMEELSPWRHFILQVTKYQLLSERNNPSIRGLCTNISLELNELLRPYKIIVNNAISTQRELDRDYENDKEKYNLEWRNRCETWKTEWLKSGGWNIPHPPFGRGGHRPPPPPHGRFGRGPPPGPPPPHGRHGPHGHPGPHFDPNQNPPPPPSYWTGGPPGLPPCGACGQQTKGPGRDTSCPASPGHDCFPNFGPQNATFPPPPPSNGWPGRSPPKQKTVYIKNGKIETY